MKVPHKASTLFAFVLLSGVLAAQPCVISNMQVVSAYNCTHNTWSADITFETTQPDSSYSIWKMILPNGNTQKVGTFPYGPPVSLGTLYKNATYQVIIINDGDSDCRLYETLVPLDCPAPCMADMLMLDEWVRCHPADNQIELRFEFPMPSFEGGFLFDVLVDSVFYTNLWMVPSGEIFVPAAWVGDTLTICQTGLPDCCQTFVVPECNDYACQNAIIGNAEPVSCDGQLAHYVFPVQHDPPGQWMTVLDIYNEFGQYVDFVKLVEGDTLADLFIPGASVDRAYAVCDLFAPFPFCCQELLIPAVSCDSLPVGVGPIDERGIRLLPNPFYDDLQIEVGNGPAGEEAMSYRIFQVNGAIVASGLIDRQSVRVDLSALPAGIYMVGFWQGASILGYRRVAKVR